MMTRNPDIFWLRFFHYTELHKTEHVPTLYQQAACLFGGMDDKVDASKMPFDRQVTDDCRSFMDALKQYREQGMDMERIKPLMEERFGSTYFFDYFFVFNNFSKIFNRTIKKIQENNSIVCIVY